MALNEYTRNRERDSYKDLAGDPAKMVTIEGPAIALLSEILNELRVMNLHLQSITEFDADLDDVT